MSSDIDKVFAGSIPGLYEEYLVPLIFEPYAEDLAARVAARAPVARARDRRRHRRRHPRAGGALPDVGGDRRHRPQSRHARDGARRSARSGRSMAPGRRDAAALRRRRIRRRRLPVRRHVLSRQGEGLRRSAPRAAAGRRVLFNVWDRIEENEFADVVTTCAGDRLPGRPAALHGAHAARLSRPRGHRARPARRRLRDAPRRSTPSRRAARRRRRAMPAIAYCQGTPLRSEIEARDRGPPRRSDRHRRRSDRAAASAAGPVDGKIQAHIVVVER